MKKSLKRAILGLFLFSIGFVSCQKSAVIPPPFYGPAQPRYSTVAEFKQGISHVIDRIGQYHILAYLDTLPNGYPDLAGRTTPLVYFGSTILEKLQGNNEQVAAGVYDVFHFDGATFSLISYLMKAEMVNAISPEVFISIYSEIPLPPVAVANFDPPLMPAVNVNQNCCDPDFKIRITWVYKPACGNYEKKFTGYKDINNGDKGVVYRLDPELTNCDCGGTWSYQLETPPGAQYVSSINKFGNVSFQGLTKGTYKITITYTCPCGAVISHTVSITIS